MHRAVPCLWLPMKEGVHTNGSFQRHAFLLYAVEMSLPLMLLFFIFFLIFASVAKPHSLIWSKTVSMYHQPALPGRSWSSCRRSVLWWPHTFLLLTQQVSKLVTWRLPFQSCPKSASSCWKLAWLCFAPTHLVLPRLWSTLWAWTWQLSISSPLCQLEMGLKMRLLLFPPTAGHCCSRYDVCVVGQCCLIIGVCPNHHDLAVNRISGPDWSWSLVNCYFTSSELCAASSTMWHNYHLSSSRACKSQC